MSYSIIEFLNHMGQAREEAVAWHDANKHFKTQRERDAFMAAYQEGAMEAKKMLTLHANLKLN